MGGAEPAPQPWTWQQQLDHWRRSQKAALAARLLARRTDYPRPDEAFLGGLLHNIGELSINISGCMNACGHHHVGNIGILGVDKRGKEFYQFTLGGSSDENASLGDRTGPGFPEDEAVDAIDTILNTYLDLRDNEAERFLDTYRRVGMQPFKEALYGTS